ncbi:MAG TPA: diacylglycerol kinase family protein [Candidatus Acidoferrum sp.]|nr:diacylglycerol kinase family protein [Candidatus Acidoferrum sp.]
MTRALVIGRQRKGRPIGHAVRETTQALQSAGWTVEHELVDRKRELRGRTKAAVKAEVDVVVVVGGDGAVLQVIQELAATSIALGIVPMGTGNLVAGNLGIPHRRDRAIEIALAGHSRRIDLGRVTVGGKRELFAVACGIGFDAEVMDGTATTQKLRWGKLAYVASAIRQGRRVQNVSHEIRLDGVRGTMKASQVFIANFGRMGLAMEPRLKVEPDDGLLDVIVVRASGPLPGLLAGWEALRQTELGESPEGHAFRARARKIHVRTKLPRLVEVDGSVIGSTPIKATIRPAALTVLVPKP